MSTVTKVYVSPVPKAKRNCSVRGHGQAVAVVTISYKSAFGGSPVSRTTYACQNCTNSANHRAGKLEN